MEKILSVLENIKGYLPLIRLADLLDVAIVAYLVYKLLSLVKSTRAANILKGVAIFLAALWLSSKLNLRVVNYILSHMVEWGVLALIIVFQPEIRRILEQLGSKNIRLLRTLAPEEELPVVDAETVTDDTPVMEEYEEPIVDSDAIVEEEDAAAATDDQNEAEAESGEIDSFDLGAGGLDLEETA